MIALLPWCGRVKQPELWDWDPFPSFLNLLQDCSLETVPHPMSFYLTSVRVANEFHIIHETLQKLKTWKHMLELKIFTYILLLHPRNHSLTIYLFGYVFIYVLPPMSYRVTQEHNYQLRSRGYVRVSTNWMPENREIYALRVLKARSPKSKYHKNMFPLKALGENSAWPLAASDACYSPWHSLSHRNLTPISASVITWHSFSVFVFVHLHLL